MTSSSRSFVLLDSFIIYNATLGPREGEEEKKILFYHPNNASLDHKVRTVGLCEAVVQFTENFDSPCKSMHTQKKRQLLYQPEPDYWMIMTVTIPKSERQRDGQTIVEYHEEEVQDSVYLAVLEQSYKMFRLFMGTFTDILRQSDLDQLKKRLEHFFLKYLSNLRLNHSDILDIHRGIHFLPLDKNTYLRIQCFVNLVEATFRQVKYTAFLYNDQLVWSGLEMDDMRTLYKYLTTSLFPLCIEAELKDGSGSKSPSPTGPNSIVSPLHPNHYGRFVLGPSNLADDLAAYTSKIPIIRLEPDEHSAEELHLLVYRALSTSICLMVDSSSFPTADWFRKIDEFVGPQLSSLASDIGEQYSRRPSVDQQFRFIYFNHMNLAQKSTVHNRSTSSALINPELLKLIADINSDFSHCEEDSEVAMKTDAGDWWVTGKKSDQREFYVIVNQRNANLIEINEEVKKLCAQNFNNIFFLD